MKKAYPLKTSRPTLTFMILNSLFSCLAFFLVASSYGQTLTKINTGSKKIKTITARNANPLNITNSNSNFRRMPPLNDEPCTATILTPGAVCSTTSSTTITATDSGITGCDGGFGPGTADDDVWFSFVATAVNHNITVTDGGIALSMIEVFVGANCGTLVSAVCHNTILNGDTTFINGFVIGTTYYFRVYSWTNGIGQGTFDVCVTGGPAANDICANAFPLTPSINDTCNAITGGTLGATDNNETGDCTVGFERAVWYYFVATATAHDVTVDGRAGFNSVIGAISACGTNTRPTGGNCTNNTGNNGIEIMNLTGLTIGNSYYVQVYELGGDQTANAFTICVTTPTPPINDACINATNLTCATTNLAGTTLNSINETVPGCPAQVNANGVWYTFTGDGTINDISTNAAAGFDQGMAIFSGGSCGSLTQIACIDGPGAGGIESYTFTATTGTTYYIYVAGFNVGAGTGNFTISRTCTPITYCEPSTESPAGDYINSVQFIGTLNDVDNLNNGFATGYQDFTTSVTNSNQQQGEGINIYVEGANSRGRFKAWVDWNQDGLFDEPGEKVYDSGNTSIVSTTFGFIIPIAQPLGEYIIRLRFYHNSNDTIPLNFDSCEDFTDGGFINQYGEAEDYAFSVLPRCDAQITSITNGEACGTNETVDLSVTGSAGVTTYRWYSDKTGGTLLATTATGDWTTPPIATTTVFWVTADNGCESYERERIIAFLNAPATLDFTPTIPIICGDDTPLIQMDASSSAQIDYLFDEDFETGLGTFTQNNITTNGAPHDAISTWQQQTSVHVPSANVWFPAISSGFGMNSFVMSNADSGTNSANGEFTENEFLSAALDASSYSSLTLELDMYFSRYNLTVAEYVNIEVSTDGGATWPNVIANITDDVGYGTNFEHLTYDLSAFAGVPNLRIRIYYFSNWGDGVAIDNLVLYGNNNISPLATWSTGAVAAGHVNIFIDPAGTIPYTGDNRSTIYVSPTPLGLQDSDTWSFSATVTLPNGCTASGTVDIENRTKYFIGPTLGDTDWNTDNNWKPFGVPDADNCVIIPDTYTSIINGTTHGDAYNVSVRDGGELNIQSDGSLTILDLLEIESTAVFDIESGGSLIQVNAVTNIGEGNIKRNSANVRDTDYIYWSSPVDNFDLSQVSATTPSYYIWQWLPTVVTNTNGFGDWERTSGNMTLGQGYILRAGLDNSDTTADTPINANFRGIFNNGDITIGVNRGSWNSGDYTGPTTTPVSNNDDNWNLLGNPYPSAINALAFLNANTNLEGAVHIWTHGTQISDAVIDPFYENFGLNYNINDYITYNTLGNSSGPGIFSGQIASGQGFFTMMEHTSTDYDVTFNNTMRDRSYGNNDFYRTPTDQTKNEERHRIWLNLIAPNNQVSTILVGYTEGATLAKDRMYDAYGMEDSNMSIYSKIDDERMIIQGRPTPFNNADLVPLGAVIPTQGIYTIAINAVDGLFTNETQNIFLEDLELGIIHNLREQPYAFTAQNQIYHDRFILRYTNHLLNIADQNAMESLSITAPANKYIKVSSATKTIKSVIVYDLLGRILINEKEINATEYKTEGFTNKTHALIVKATLSNGQEKTQKVILK